MAKMENQQKTDPKKTSSKILQPEMFIHKDRKKVAEEHIKINQRLQDLEIEEVRMSKKFEVFELAADDLKDMFEFLQLETEDDKYSLDKKINATEKPKKLFFILKAKQGYFELKEKDQIRRKTKMMKKSRVKMKNR